MIREDGALMFAMGLFVLSILAFGTAAGVLLFVAGLLSAIAWVLFVVRARRCELWDQPRRGPALLSDDDPRISS